MTDNEDDIEQQMNNLLLEDDFEKLELALKEPNIFEILKSDDYEIRHSNFLAWLFNPAENHGLGDFFLKKFVKELFSDYEKEKDKRSIVDITKMDFSNVEIRREWGHIDILIIMEEDVFCIENKIKATDSENQLSRYHKLVKNDFAKNKNGKDYIPHFIYLTPFGDEPNDKEALECWHLFSYAQIVNILESIIEIYGKSLQEKISVYINDYITSMRRNILMNDELNEKAKEIYKKYSQVIEYIYNNKPDYAEQMYEYLENTLKEADFIIGSKNKGYIRFTTKPLAEKIPNCGNGWSGKELFLFELDYSDGKNISLKAIISPSENKKERQKIIDAVNALDGEQYVKESNKKFFVFYNSSKKKGFDIKKILEYEQEKIEETVKNTINKFIEKAKEIELDLLQKLS